MAETSARLALPLLVPGQAQKEMFHNEALAVIDLALQATAVAVGLDAPPPSPTPGQCWVVGTQPVGDWAGQPGVLAGWTAGGWRFVAPVDGMAVWDAAGGQVARFTGDAWQSGTVNAAQIVVAGHQVVGARQPAIAAPAGGDVIDTGARATLTAVLAALRTHGLIAT